MNCGQDCGCHRSRRGGRGLLRCLPPGPEGGEGGVTVLDRGTIGCEASTAAAGMLAPQCEAPGPGPFLDFCLAARRYYEQLAPELKEISRTDIEYRDCGIIYLLEDARDEAAEGRYRWQRDLGLKVGG